MIENINLEQVRQYNSSLKQYRDKSAQLNAEIDYINKEIQSLCLELTNELGVQVNRDNVEQICREQADKINSALQSGNAVLAKIANEEQSVTQSVQNMQSTTQQVVQPTPVQPVMQQTPVQQTPVQPTVQPAINTSIGYGQQQSMNLPPLFSRNN